MSLKVCVDASLMVALLVPERFSQAALKLWKDWATNDWQVVAPFLIRYEVTSALYRKTLKGVISGEDVALSLNHFLDLQIDFTEPPDLGLLAIQLAAQFKRPNTYDTHYLALAISLDCPFWTGDERVFNTVHESFPWVNGLGQLSQ